MMAKRICHWKLDVLSFVPSPVSLPLLIHVSHRQPCEKQLRGVLGSGRARACILFCQLERFSVLFALVVGFGVTVFADVKRKWEKRVWYTAMECTSSAQRWASRRRRWGISSVWYAIDVDDDDDESSRSRSSATASVFELCNARRATLMAWRVWHMAKYVLAKWAFLDETGKDDTVGNVQENKNLITSALCSLSFRDVSLCFATPIFFVLFFLRLCLLGSRRSALNVFSQFYHSLQCRTLSFKSRRCVSFATQTQHRIQSMFCCVVNLQQISGHRMRHIVYFSGFFLFFSALPFVCVRCARVGQKLNKVLSNASVRIEFAMVSAGTDAMHNNNRRRRRREEYLFRKANWTKWREETAATKIDKRCWRSIRNTEYTKPKRKVGETVADGKRGARKKTSFEKYEESHTWSLSSLSAILPESDCKIVCQPSPTTTTKI